MGRYIRLPETLGSLELQLPPGVEELFESMDTDDSDAEDRIPYWAEIWPSADGLIRFLLSGRGPSRPGLALELGSGLGLAGLAALRMNWNLYLSDFRPEALEYLRINLKNNGYAPERARLVDWRSKPLLQYNSILGSDILYEQRFLEPLSHFLQEALLPGAAAWIAEPGRPVSDAIVHGFREHFRVREHAARSRVDGKWKRIRVLEIRTLR
ncbi:MAG: hypothetical protein QF492_06745 [Candidatus Krumholzibacteria bacterium]|jgi:predicted nicotinamide N-methyase|nr:hypothetical protein [Candidatus Krumholzibacteria bacterium]MDP6669581.1 hypothetical protein [Candidatus Krumholzibacteria bacterium]MDP6797401.1 hypothetical protein [Candidatus Krumholzibacteria bacterium]MDP7021045.1 hypothetical protein [Candidatus Krumholzibacteria bacterium]